MAPPTISISGMCSTINPFLIVMNPEFARNGNLFPVELFCGLEAMKCGVFTINRIYPCSNSRFCILESR